MEGYRRLADSPGSPKNETKKKKKARIKKEKLESQMQPKSCSRWSLVRTPLLSLWKVTVTACSPSTAGTGRHAPRWPCPQAQPSTPAARVHASITRALIHAHTCVHTRAHTCAHRHHIYPSASERGWFQGLPQIPKSTDARVPHVRRRGICTYPTRIPACPSRLLERTDDT